MSKTEQQRFEEVQSMYNTYWNLYKEYLKDHDMALFNSKAQALKERFEDVRGYSGFVVWWAGVVNGHQAMYESRGD